MKKSWTFIFIIFLFSLLLCSSPAHALFEDTKDAEARLQNFCNFTEDNAVIVLGSDISSLERLTYFELKQQYPTMSAYPVKNDTNFVIEDFQGKVIILIGGPAQNTITAKVFDRNIPPTDTIDMVAGRVIMIQGEKNKYVIFSDKNGLGLPRTARSNSPFAKIMPVEVVPIAAAASGIFLIWLWAFLSKIGVKVATGAVKGLGSNKILDRIKKKKELKEEFHGFMFRGVRFKTREWIAVIIAAIIFSFSVSYMYLKKDVNLLIFFGANILFNVLFQSMKNIVRLIADRHRQTHSEYILWYWGAFVTLITGWLGQTFSLAGLTISNEQPDSNAQKTSGKIAYFTNLGLIVIFLILFFLWMFATDSTFVQMIMIMALTAIFIDMMPFKPFPGQKMLQWSKLWYWITFLVMLVFYFCLLVL